jgi:hypothetical protein
MKTNEMKIKIERAIITELIELGAPEEDALNSINRFFYGENGSVFDHLAEVAIKILPEKPESPDN